MQNKRRHRLDTIHTFTSDRTYAAETKKTQQTGLLSIIMMKELEKIDPYPPD